MGFKYHANVLDCLGTAGHFGPVSATVDDFIIGVEESHGLLVTPEIRDKDAAGAAILLAELAAIQRQQGATLLDYLDALYKRYGYCANLLTSMVMTGAEGLANIETIQHTLRQHPPDKVAGFAVTQMIDHWDETGVHGPFVSDTDRASRNMLVFHLDQGHRSLSAPLGQNQRTKFISRFPPLRSAHRPAMRHSPAAKRTPTR